jgi:hypothetical protein
MTPAAAFGLSALIGLLQLFEDYVRSQGSGPGSQDIVINDNGSALTGEDNAWNLEQQ